MRVIVASDIHGITDELRALAYRLSPDAELLSPWAQPGCPCASEAEAHAAFIADGGVESYAEKIAQAVAGAPAFIVGFSAGATAAWLYCASTNCDPRSRAVLFYGSRIRLHRNCVPRCRVRAVFAEHEPGFTPAELAADLRRNSEQSGQNLVVEIEANARHGFMNPLSTAYSADLAEKHLARMRSELSRAGHTSPP